MSSLLIQYVLTAAVRDKLIVSLIVLFILAASLSVFFGSSAVTEQDQFTLVFAGSTIRLCGVMGLVLFVVFFMRRSFDSKDVEFLLSRPVGRVEYLLSYAAAFSLIGALTGMSQGVAMYILGPHLFSQGTALWIVSIIIENIIIMNVALFFAMFFASAASAAMSTFAFYVLGRMMGQLLGIIDTNKADASEAMEFTMQVVSVLMPRLDLLGQSSWLVYQPDVQTNIAFVIIQGAVFVSLVLSAALLDLLKRQF